MKIKKLSFKNFLAFKSLDVEFSPKVNVIIGENSTGKTSILKMGRILCSKNNEYGISLSVLNSFRPLVRNKSL